MLKERDDLRDHAARGRRLHEDRPGARQAQRPGRPGRPRPDARLPPRRRASCRRSSTSSRSWPTRRRKSTTRDIAALIEQAHHGDRRPVAAGPLRAQARPRRHARPPRSRSRAAAKQATDTFVGGDGPIDAVFLAIEKITGIRSVVRDFRVHSVTAAKTPRASRPSKVEHHGHLYRGRGVSTDTSRPAPRRS